MSLFDLLPKSGSISLRCTCLTYSAAVNKSARSSRPPSISSMNSHSVNSHFSRIMKGDRPTMALLRHEHYLFSHMKLVSGMQILEIGCGVGTAAFELANFVEASIIGLDADPSKVSISNGTSYRTDADSCFVREVARANLLASQKGISTRVKFVSGVYRVTRITQSHALCTSENSTGSYEDLFSTFQSNTFDVIYAIESLKVGGVPFSAITGSMNS